MRSTRIPFQTIDTASAFPLTKKKDKKFFGRFIYKNKIKIDINVH